MSVYSVGEIEEHPCMNQKWRVVIAEDHMIIREGLRSLISSTKEFEVVGEAENGRQAIECVEKIKPDLVLTDLSMPKMDGMDMIERVKKRSPDTKIIALTVHQEEDYVLTTLKAGADGYVLKDASYGELVTAMRTVLDDKHYLSPQISGKLIEGYLEGRKSQKVQLLREILTRREREILNLIAEGYTNKEISDSLYLSVHTVETHRHHIMEKLNVHSTAALISLAVEKGILTKK